MFTELIEAVLPFLHYSQEAAALNAGHEALPQVPDPQLELVEVPSPAPQDYDPLELRIGGESLSQIYLQLICKYKGKGELPDMDDFLERAESLFQKKKAIFLKLGVEELDPGRGWLVDGSQFIKNKRGNDYSEASLNAVFESLRREGRDSPYFSLSKKNLSALAKFYEP